MNKIIKVKDRPIDGRTPTMSISGKLYLKGLVKLRKQAKEEKRKLMTNNGIEDYSK
jgi:hypothetical protein